MSQEKDQNEMNENEYNNKPKIITGYILYNKKDNLSKLFETFNEFRVKYNLKYSHYESIIYFNVNSEHLNDIYKILPFQISKYHTKSIYNCNKDIADLLLSRKDSFVRMRWDDITESLSFTSRTTPKIHQELVKRIFNENPRQTIIWANYKILKNENNEKNTKLSVNESTEININELKENINESQESNKSTELKDNSENITKELSQDEKKNKDSKQKYEKKSKIIKEYDTDKPKRGRIAKINP